MVQIRTATVVDIGTTMESNDDRALVRTTIYNEAAGVQENQVPLLVAVCDGVGGYSGGGYAANLALTQLIQYDVESFGKASYLQCVLNDVNAEILRHKQTLPSFAKMCTTIAGIWFSERSMMIFHAGDSRVYRFDGRLLTRMTRDHSLVQELVDNGVINETEAAVCNERNVIRRCLGIADCPPPEIYECNVPAYDGEIYMLCSDGLWEGVSNDQIAQILAQEIPLEVKADLLVDAAKFGGSEDNISVCLCQISAERVMAQKKTRYILD